MAKKINISQLQSKLRQIESNQRQAINKYNQEVRKHNQNIKNAVNKYNSAVGQHNVRVRANRQRIINELNRLQSRTTVRYQVLHTSTVSLNRSYQSLEKREQEFENIPFGNQFLDLSEKENANSLAVSNAMESDEPQTNAGNDGDLISTYITGELIEISLDLDSRWKGALFSLSPMNPDASRHFCTSAREIFIQILDHFAPDTDVLTRFPQCEKTDKGQPTRRWKIKHILVNSGIVSEEAVEFVDEDITNVLQLFRVFNDGTHGSAGRFEFSQLRAIKERVESGIVYLTTICKNT
ncbi:pPIWI-associating nuclease domain-containing protein [Shewanella sp. 1180_01]|uniref:pPIWI-associating nuclease domain-containing protein n=1 Tax=Shewanella sp. 1180_01 TaxID=2604451 RepID=UPI00406358F4